MPSDLEQPLIDQFFIQYDLLLRLHGAEALGREYVVVRLSRAQVNGHLDYSAISRILSSIRKLDDWYPVWERVGETFLRQAEAAEAAGHRVTAGEAFLRAAACFQFGQLGLPVALKERGHRRAVELYRRGAPYYEPPAEPVRIHLPDEGVEMPGYLRLPVGVERPPVVVMIDGADMNKEEFHHWGTEFTRRGLAVLTFDGPGQGELSARYGVTRMHLDRYELAVSACIDYLQTRPEVDALRVGCYGASLGGYLALRSAGHDERLLAAISNGGLYDGRYKHRWTYVTLENVRACFGTPTMEATRQYLAEKLSLAGVCERIRCPYMVIHGNREDLLPLDESRRMALEGRGLLVVFEDGWHTCTNRDHILSPLVADWIAAKLRRDERGTPREFQEVWIRDESDYASVLGIPI